MGAMADRTLVRLCDAAEIDPDMPLRVERDGEAFAVYAAEGGYYVTADQCTHGPGLLSDGFVEGFEVECPFHQGRFDIRTGAPTVAPCMVPVKAWDVTLIDGGVYIDIAHPRSGT